VLLNSKARNIGKTIYLTTQIKEIARLQLSGIYFGIHTILIKVPKERKRWPEERLPGEFELKIIHPHYPSSCSERSSCFFPS
jgi:hypothetical protein